MKTNHVRRDHLFEACCGPRFLVRGDSRAGGGVGTLTAKPGKASDVPRLEAGGTGTLVAGRLEAGVLCDR